MKDDDQQNRVQDFNALQINESAFPVTLKTSTAEQSTSDAVCVDVDPAIIQSDTTTLKYQHEPALQKAIESTPAAPNIKKEEIIPPKVKLANDNDIDKKITKNTQDKTLNTNGDDVQIPIKNEQNIIRPKAGKENWIKKKSKTTASKIVLIPGVVVALIAYLLPIIIPDLDKSLFAPEELATLPQAMQDNMSTIIKMMVYAVGLAAIIFSLKAKSKGSLSIFDTYVVHKTGLLSKKKILIPNIISIDIHHNPFSALGDVGNLEITSTKGDILFENCPNPESIKENIVAKRMFYEEKLS